MPLRARGHAPWSVWEAPGEKPPCRGSRRFSIARLQHGQTASAFTHSRPLNVRSSPRAVRYRDQQLSLRYCAIGVIRSEERHVGKECRYRRAPQHESKKEHEEREYL